MTINSLGLVCSACGLLCLFVFFSQTFSLTSAKYTPDWKSLDSRPLPAWYDEGKFGIFIHWGVFSVPSYISEWFWWYWRGTKPRPTAVKFMLENYRPDFTYADFAADFTTEFYNPDVWADLFNASGARYVVLTTKHHEGFTMWPSSVSFNWNSKDCGPNRDLVGELASAVRSRTDIHLGLYHSLFEWFNPVLRQDEENNFTTKNFVTNKAMPELYEIVNTYKPDVVWSDGDPAPVDYWGSKEFLAWLYNDSPVKDTVVTNDRWGEGTGCKHGGFFTCADRYNPGKLQNHKWENAMTIDKQSWGYRRDANIKDYLSIEEIISTFIETISCGGNMLMNIGPTKDGTIEPVFEERLRQMGQWLGVNGEAVYSSKPWLFQNDTETKQVWYTMKPGSAVYAFILFWPDNGTLTLGAPITTSSTVVTMIGYPGHKFTWTSLSPSGIRIHIPPIPYNSMPCEWAWVFKLQGLGN